MTNNELFSFCISSDFSSFRKFDSSGDFYLTYYFIPRPTVLGILASIIGLEKSSANSLPWWEELKDTKIGITPLLNKDFIKHLVVYNNSTGAASFDDKKRGQTLIIREQLLIKPQYRIYVELNSKTDKIFNLLKNHRSVFTPYLGKNEFRAEISNIQKNTYVPFSGTCEISSIYPLCSEISKKSYQTTWIDQNETIQILESHPYMYGNDYKYVQENFVFSINKKVNTESIKTQIDGIFVQLDNKKVVYLYGGRK
ncbi:MAG: type I-B CRISPR-associated protein Cas5b [Candidatus Micrarchaeia archaeon]